MEFKEIWGVFAAIDKADLPIAKKGNMGLDYLSWAHALHLAISEFPELTFNCDKEKVYDDGTMMVYASVTISDHTREMWLPVMDYKNKAIDSPSSRDISDAKMRCLTKCLAMFGLGHYIYAGEDIPSESSGNSVAAKSQPKPKASKPNGKIKEHGVFIAHDTVIQAINRKEDLQAHFKSNKEELAKLKESHPDVAEAIVASFKERLATLTN